jgi:hypothetical protein
LVVEGVLLFENKAQKYRAGFDMISAAKILRYHQDDTKNGFFSLRVSWFQDWCRKGKHAVPSLL